MARSVEYYSGSRNNYLMDRVDEWRLFAAVASRRSFVQAARALRRSPQAMTRAVASLEARLGVRLLNRTTRSVSLTSDGERYLQRSVRALAELDALEYASEADAPLAGLLSLTAPVLFGQLHVAPVVGEFLREHPALDARLFLVDRIVSLADEGLDLGVRIGALPDSALRARVVGHVRLVACASPDYLKRAGRPRRLEDLAKHTCIANIGATPIADRWAFPGDKRERSVSVHARLIVNTSQAAIDAAVAGLGITRALSYQVDHLVAANQLQLVLESFEPPSAPVQLVQLPGAPNRAAAAFAEFAVGRLAQRLGRTKAADRRRTS
jgi:DNA-binding transcriptional LysR family regulator